MCDFTEINPYIAELRSAQQANPSPAEDSASRDALDGFHPLDPPAAGDLSTTGTSA